MSSKEQEAEPHSDNHNKKTKKHSNIIVKLCVCLCLCAILSTFQRVACGDERIKFIRKWATRRSTTAATNDFGDTAQYTYVRNDTQQNTHVVASAKPTNRPEHFVVHTFLVFYFPILLCYKIVALCFVIGIVVVFLYTPFSLKFSILLLLFKYRHIDEWMSLKWMALNVTYFARNASCLSLGHTLRSFSLSKPWKFIIQQSCTCSWYSFFLFFFLSLYVYVSYTLFLCYVALFIMWWWCVW